MPANLDAVPSNYRKPLALLASLFFMWGFITVINNTLLPHLLMFEKINGFKDVPGFNVSHDAFLAMAARKGLHATVTDKGGAFTPATLRKYDAVIWNNISGDVLTLSQRKALRAGGARPVVTLDEATYNPEGFAGQQLKMGDHPIAWTRQVGKGRMFYSGIGHLLGTYSDPRYVAMLEDALGWAITLSAKAAR